MHRPWISTSSFAPACGKAAASASRSSGSARPAWRNAIWIASGFAVAARWSPSTPFSAATIASRSRDGRLAASAPARVASAGVSTASSVSTLPPTSLVTPRIVL